MDFKINSMDPSIFLLNQFSNVPVAVPAYIPIENKPENQALGNLADILIEANNSSEDFEKDKLKGLLKIDTELTKIEEELAKIVENGILVLEKADALLKKLWDIEHKLDDLQKRLSEYRDISKKKNADNNEVENKISQLGLVRRFGLIRRQIGNQKELNIEDIRKLYDPEEKP